MEMKGRSMLSKLRSALLILVSAAAILQLQGCFFERREHRGDGEHMREHDRGHEHADLDIHVH